MTCELDKLKQKHIDEIINIFQKGKISEKESHLCLKYMTKAVEDVRKVIHKEIKQLDVIDIKPFTYEGIRYLNIKEILVRLAGEEGVEG